MHHMSAADPWLAKLLLLSISRRAPICPAFLSAFYLKRDVRLNSGIANTVSGINEYGLSGFNQQL